MATENEGYARKDGPRMVVTHDPDIGRCDDCGTEDGRRYRTVVQIVVGGVPEQADAWLCTPCRRIRRARQWRLTS